MQMFPKKTNMDILRRLLCSSDPFKKKSLEYLRKLIFVKNVKKKLLTTTFILLYTQKGLSFKFLFYME